MQQSDKRKNIWQCNKHRRRCVCFCSSLTSIEIPSSVTSIGYEAFYDCSSLTSVTFAEDSQLKSIGEEVFCNCEKLKSIEIPSSVTSIGYEAFCECSSLIDITIPEGVTTIAEYAFAYCNSLNKVEFADNSQLKKIEEKAFYGCENLTSITIPESILSIGDHALGFYYEYYYDENTEKWVYDDYAKVADFVISGYTNSAADSYATDNGITFNSIGTINLDEEIASGNCGDDGDNVKWSLNRGGTLTISGSGDTEFDREDDDEYNPWEGYTDIIKTAVIGEEITSIGSCAFEDCINLKEVTFEGESQLTSIERNAFWKCSSLTSIEIPSSVTNIERCAFYDCSSLKSVIIPESVTSIESSVFENCSSLASVTISSNITGIGDWAFASCRSLTSVTFAEDSQLKDIEEEAFYNCTNLKSIEIPSSVTSIGYEAFYKCSSLTCVTFADNSQLKKIKEEAFYDCTNLKSIEIPKSVYIINEHALGYYYNINCDSCYDEETDEDVDNEYAKVTGFTISGYTNSAADIYATDNGITFNSIGTINLDEEIASGNCGDAATWSLNGGGTLTITGSGDMEFDWEDNDNNLWKNYSEIIKNVVIGEGITSIESCAFEDCINLTSITIPASVTSIGSYAFDGCEKLTSIEIPSGVTEIEYGAFRHCNNLEKITIPKNVTSIGESAFAYCNSLEEVTIKEDSQLKKIEEEAFYNCENLKSIEIPENVYIIGEHALGFYEINDGNVYEEYAKVADFVISGYTNSAADSYATDNGITFNSVGTIDLNEEIATGNCGDDGDNVKWSLNRGGTLTISGSGDMDFEGEDYDNNPWEYYSDAIKTVVIGEGITSIESYAFYDCSRLTSVTIPEKITSIGSYAFYDCSSLTSVAIPSSVTSIGSYAFENCINLKEVTFAEGSQLTSIGNAAFEDCINLESITIPKNVTSIGNFAFIRCGNLTSVTIPASVTSIGSYAFDSCSSLESVTFAENSKLTNIGREAFYDCKNLKSIEIPKDVVNISEYALGYYCNSYYDKDKDYDVINEEVIDGFTIKGYEKSAAEIYANNNKIDFDGSKGEVNPAEVTVSGACGDNVTWTLNLEGEMTISGSGDMDFNYSSKYNNPWENYRDVIKNIVINKGVTSIENNAFYYCGSLTSIKIPEGVTYIGYAAFYQCENLESVTIPSTVLSIGDRAFGYYYNDGYEDSGETELVSGFKITGAENSAAEIYANENNIKFESDGTKVDPEKITVSGTCGDKITWTLNLKGEMTISGSGDMQFADAAYPVGPWYDYKYTIKTIVIKDGITNIAKGAFSTCFNLTNITIPTSVTSIEDNAFYYCSKLESIEIPDSVTNMGSYVFEGCSNLKEVTLSNSITCLGTAVFAFCTSLESITIPSSVTSIGNSAFTSCNKLTKITIPEGVKEIGDSAFFYIEGLKEVEIPESVETIGQYAFGYYYFQNEDEWEGSYQKYDGFTIKGAENSAAQTYANENNITFKPTSVHKHTIVKVAAKDATCTEAGNHEYWTCSVCKKVFSDAAGTEETTAEKTTIPALGHDYQDVAGTAKAATCTEAGTTADQKCSRCDAEIKGEAIPALGHTLEKTDASDATCTEAGNHEYYTCSVCKKVFSDVAGTVETTAEKMTIPALGHDYQDVAGTAKAATCTEAGTTADQKCSRCDAEIKGEAIPALGHDYQDVAGTAKAATCTEAGKKADQKCSRCDAGKEGEAIPALGHDYQDVAGTAKAATCTEAGKKADQKCSRCDAGKEGDAIPALGHELKLTAATNATCGKAGNSAYWTCATCGKYFSDAEGKNEIEKDSWIIPATGKHSLNSGVVTKKATATANGTITYTCKVCKQVIKTTTIKKATILTAKVATKTVTYAKAKKKAQTLTPITAKSGVGAKITYKVTKYGNSKAKKYLSLNTKTGKVTVKKGTPKGTYKITVKVSAAATTKYAAASKTVTVTIKVK